MRLKWEGGASSAETMLLMVAEQLTLTHQMNSMPQYSR